MWADLPADIFAELKDAVYGTRQHYSRATYALGCRGPLCRKAERDRGRRRNEQRGGEDYNPAMNLRIPEPENINEIIEWHLAEVESRKVIQAS